MINEKIIKELADIHNMIASISVHGDDAIIMANAILKTRELVNALRDETVEELGE